MDNETYDGIRHDLLMILGSASTHSMIHPATEGEPRDMLEACRDTLQLIHQSVLRVLAQMPKRGRRLLDEVPPGGCICTGICDCANPEPADPNAVALVSNECPVHNLNPRPHPECPVHS